MEKFREKIEEFGNFYEKQGFSPVASRIMIYLFLHPEGEATFDELVQYFSVSKSAVSNAIKILSVMDVISEKTKAGARKRYFKVTPEKLFAPETVIKGYRDCRMIFENIRTLRNSKDNISDELLKVTQFIKLVEKEYTQLYNEMLKSLNH